MYAFHSTIRNALTKPTPLLSKVPLFRHTISTLPENPHIYVHPQGNSFLLSLLPIHTPRLSLGTTTSLPPTPETFTENPVFLPILHRLLRQHAANDPIVQSDALQFASPAGASLFGKNNARRAKREGGAGGANYQGGSGGGGVGGWLHVYDQRGIPVFGRIAETEDIFGSLLVDSNGKVKEGEWEENRMYRLITGNGVMQLSPYLREKVTEGLRTEEMEG
ncbi:hypothetical protein K440DRAFT_252949 [Wilcoxina mikolae CBS 423.85]|nr:hypothetical protein K440DRAFT_252949 [Wilcoxina mikolae CBS 423.85]